MRETASAASSPTHRTSCARRSPPSASTPRSRSRIRTGSTAEELADVVLAEQQRMQRLVEDLLLLARADEHVRAAARAGRPRRPGLRGGHRLRVHHRRHGSTHRRSTAARVQGDVDALAPRVAQPRRERRPARGEPDRARSGRARRRRDADGRRRRARESRNPNGRGC